MPPEEITKEKSPVSAEPKQEVVESVPAVEEPPVSKVTTDEQVAPTEEVENQTEQVETPKVIEPATETPIIETTEPPQTETKSIPPITEAEQPQPIEPIQQNQTQEIPTQPQQPQIKIIEKIIYQTPPNFIQNLLNKARAKIQERKRKKLNKILSLFETKSQITNSDIQKLLRVSRATSKRYMDILEKENKVTQVGNTGKGVFYTKKQ